MYIWKTVKLNNDQQLEKQSENIITETVPELNLSQVEYYNKSWA